MAHENLKEMISSDKKVHHIFYLLSLSGIFLYINAFIIDFIYNSSYYGDFLALIAAILLCFPLIYNAILDSNYGQTDMNELAAIGVLASLSIGHYYTACAISSFMIVSIYIEYRSSMGTQLSIESLMNYMPSHAIKLIDNKEEKVHVNDLQIGDIVRVKPGDRIPADGIVIYGTSDVNQSSITGESQLIPKDKGKNVYGGTINISGLLDIQIHNIGDKTTIGKVKQLIVQAQKSKTPVEKLISKYAKWYTPFILILAGMVLFFTRDIQRSISMLVVACPCAILLSSPTAIVAALGAASRTGLFIKNTTDLEIAKNVSAVVFDKTGTITTGTFSVSDVILETDTSKENLIKIACSLANHSNHPVSRSILKLLTDKYTFTDVTKFQEVPGKGVQGIIQNKLVRMGRQNWLIDQGVQIPDKIQIPEDITDIHISQNKNWIGCIGLKDSIRPDAAHITNQLQMMGIKEIILLTGDRKIIAQKIAEILCSTNVIAEAFPNEKVEAVKKLQQNGHIVAVIGDGVNDAPALAAANVSIAMSTLASDVAIESASIALMNDKLNRIPFLFQLSSQTIRIIRQNLLISIACIIIFLGLSAAGYIHPILAAILHCANAICVILNSARLVRFGEYIDYN